MGNNIDFPYLFGIPEVKCPKCRESVMDQLSEWDIDCGTIHDGGTYGFEIICDKCDTEFDIEIKSNSIVFLNGKEIKDGPKCAECGLELISEEEINYGQCDKCCAWKYRSCDK